MLKIRSDDDPELYEWQTFHTVTQVSHAAGIRSSSFRTQKKIGKPITCRSTRQVYKVRRLDCKVKTNCIDCSNPLNLYDLAKSFSISNGEEFNNWFHSHYAAAKVTKIHHNTWDNAAIQLNTAITHRAKSGCSGPNRNSEPSRN